MKKINIARLILSCLTVIGLTGCDPFPVAYENEPAVENVPVTTPAADTAQAETEKSASTENKGDTKDQSQSE